MVRMVIEDEDKSRPAKCTVPMMNNNERLDGEFKSLE